MGTYTPIKPGKERSIDDTLREAEEEHYLDCPDADIPIRTAALILDLIFLSLASTAIGHLFSAVYTYSSHWFAVAGATEHAYVLLDWGIQIFTVTAKVVVVVFYFSWAVTRFGATAGKLLLGLRVLDVTDGKSLPMTRSFLRELILKPLTCSTGVALVSSLLRKDRRSLHDMALRTVVKKVHQ